MTEVVRYEISSDEKGLLGYLNTGNFYHIHSDDMSELETWIYNILREKEYTGHRKEHKFRDWAWNYAMEWLALIDCIIDLITLDFYCPNLEIKLHERYLARYTYNGWDKDELDRD